MQSKYSFTEATFNGKYVEQSSGKAQVNGLCGKLCLLKHIQLFSHSRTWIHRPYSLLCFLEWTFLTFTQIMYNQLTFRLHRQVRFPRRVFWDGIFNAISQKNTLLTFSPGNNYRFCS